MLQHREQEAVSPVTHEYSQSLPDQHTETQPTVSQKSWWRTLYDMYVTDNPVYWKESQRPDLSALNPKMRAKALANREKREATPKAWWRGMLESLAGIAIFSGMFWGFSQIMVSAKIPLFVFYVSPLMGMLGTGIGLTRNIILEREKRTWDALLLSHLTPAQILLGKLLPWLKQVGWVALSSLLFILPGLWQGTVPLWSLLIAAPLIVTAPLPLGMLALREGLKAPSMERGVPKSGRLAALPVLANALAAGAGAVGMLALQRSANGVLPAWLGILTVTPWVLMVVNLAWTRSLWRVLLRDFHKTPGDFSG